LWGWCENICVIDTLTRTAFPLTQDADYDQQVIRKMQVPEMFALLG